MPTPNSWSDSDSTGLSGSVNVDALLGGTRWTSSNVTYSFPGTDSLWNTSGLTGYGPSGSGEEPWSISFAPLAESDQAYFSAAAQQWANVANVHLTLVAETPTNVGDIRAAYSYLDSTADAQAWAYKPSDTSYGGDVWFNALGTSASYYWTPGSYEYLVAVHELGHALGLKHPFSGSVVLPTSLDSMSSTVMSYSAQPGDQSTGFDFYPTTPMVLDIAAMQRLYGANDSYHAGNDSYVYSDATQYHETIWDGGGSDAIQYSGALNSVIDLRSGTDYGSRIGLPVFVISGEGVNLYSVNNVWIANGVVIENAAGGDGDDLLVGNDANNVLDGGGGDDGISGGIGNDTLIGGAGDDMLDGGPGTDTLTGGAGDDAYVVDSAGDTVIESADAGTDTVTSKMSWVLQPNVENLVLAGTKKMNGTGNDGDNQITGNSGKNALAGGPGNDSLAGGSGNDTLNGGEANDTLSGDDGKDVLDGGPGNDALHGGDGVDTLSGGDGDDTLYSGAGADTVSGGVGHDVFVFDNPAGGGTDKISDFSALDDEFAFDDAVFHSLAGGIDAGNLVFAVKPAAQDADDYLLFDTKSGKLYYDDDGSGSHAAVLLATVKGTLAGLDADNFTLL